MTSPYPPDDHSFDYKQSKRATPSNASGNVATSSASSTIRPRTRRLLSSSTELTNADLLGARVGDASSSARAVSPIPPPHPSRIASGQKSANGKPIGGLVLSGQGGPSGRESPTMAFGKGLWGGVWTSSWSAVQGMASSYLGGDVGSGNDADYDSGSLSRNGSKVRVKGTSSKKKMPETWGPSGLRQRADSIGARSSAETDTRVNTKKTASILESYEGVNGGLDVNANYKRRSSFESHGAPAADEEALCYLHHVKPTDTQAGVILKYQCRDQGAFRKANRLYPNDAIQLRKVVLLPVDTCTIKGRPCDGPSDEPIDLLAPTPSHEYAPNTSHANETSWGATSQAESSTIQDNPFAQTSNKDASDDTWVHVRWVLLDASPSSKPTEIVRLPRKTLGFFPPRRRKSQSVVSAFSTPRASLDHFRDEPSNSPLGTPIRRGSSLASHPPQPQSSSESYFPASTLHTPQSRRNSTISETQSGALPSFMRRPGGVGTMARNVRRPGPAQDGFNAWATKQFPTLTIDHLSSMSTHTLSSDIVGFGFKDELASIDEIPSNLSAVAASGVSTPGGSNLIPNIGSAASAVEGWMRKMAALTPGTPRLGPKNGSMVEGDLIELLDGAGSDDGKGFELGATPTGSKATPGPPSGVSGREETSSGVRGRTGKGKSD